MKVFASARLVFAIAVFLFGSIASASIPVRSKSNYGSPNGAIFSGNTPNASEVLPGGFEVGLECTVSNGCPNLDFGQGYGVMAIFTPNLAAGTIIDITGDTSLNLDSVGLFCEGTPFIGSCTSTDPFGTGFQAPLSADQQACVDSIGDVYHGDTNVLELSAASCANARELGTNMALVFSVSLAELPDIKITTATPATTPEPNMELLLGSVVVVLMVAKRYNV